MKNGDGLSKRTRRERILRVEPFDLIEGNVESLLHQAKAIAGFIRLYNDNNRPQGCFDELLADLERPQGADGTTEPSQGLLLVFVRQLSQIIEQFNRRWDHLPMWYLNEVLRVENLPARQDHIWISLQKSGSSILSLSPGTRFLMGGNNGTASVYRVKEHIELEQVHLARVLSVAYDKADTIYPASQLGCVTSVEVNRLPAEASRQQEQLFSGRGNCTDVPSPGFVVSSPALLLREGQRSVSIRFESETAALTRFVEQNKHHFDGTTQEQIAEQITHGIFHLTVSTAEGWQHIEHYHVRNGKAPNPNHLTLTFTLYEHVAATAPCTQALHGLHTDHPCVRVELDRDAWLYPYSWIKEVALQRVVIDTAVEGISGVMVYNDLGRVDNSKPFVPFGVNTERGAWLAVGNYEMAAKNTTSIDLNIQWGQLPDDPGGLYEYYKAYNAEIDNESFRVRAGYLQDYRWKTDPCAPCLPLFGSQSHPRGALAKNTTLRGIDTSRMPAVRTPEEQYDYTIRTRSGFACLILDEPSMGLGEKRYRQLFADRLSLATLKKRRSADPLNPPVTPQIERLTLNYRAHDTIELHRAPQDERHQFWHITPLGYKKIYPNNQRHTTPLIYSMEHDAHLLLGLEGVHGGEVLRLYFDFVPMRTKIESAEYPLLEWSWGDGIHWTPLADGMMTRDTTKNFLISGQVVFCIPPDVPQSLRDDRGVVWLRASVVRGREYMAALSHLYTNAVELVRHSDEHVAAADLKKGDVRPMNEVGGLGELVVVSAPRREHTAETDLGKLLRVSEYITHRGKGVTARDFERLVLQAFPEVGKVKCLQAGSASKGKIRVVVVPRRTQHIGPLGWSPQSSSDLLCRVEQYLSERCSAAVSKVEAINPLYEEVFVRCRIRYKAGYSLAGCHSELQKLCNRIIAPWQYRNDMPLFDHKLQVGKIRHTVRQKEFVDRLEFLSVVRIAQVGGKQYRIDEYRSDSDTISPSTPYAAFIPARHIFNCSESDELGLGELEVEHTLILERTNTTL